MANPKITNHTVQTVRLGENDYQEVTIESGQDLSEGSVLGIQSIALGTASAVTGTGDGTITAYALSATGSPAAIGTYTLTCTVAAANNGTFELVGPDGAVIDNAIVMAAGTAVFTGAGMTFTINDGAADFIVGDFFTLTITAGSGNLLLSVSTSADGSEAARFVLGNDIDTSATGTNADTAFRVINKGLVREDMLIFGGSDTIDTIINGQSQREHLRDYTIIAQPAVIIDNLENQ